MVKFSTIVIKVISALMMYFFVAHLIMVSQLLRYLLRLNFYLLTLYNAQKNTVSGRVYIV